MLPTAEVHLLRSLKKTCIVLLLMLRLDRPLSRNQVAAYLDIHVHTSRQYLRQLSAANLVAHTSSGWILTQAGSQLVLPMGGGAKITPPMLINNINRLRNNDSQKDIINRGGENNTPPANILPAIWSRLLSYGVDRNSRVELIVEKPFMTLDYLSSHVASLELKGYPMPKWAGMLVLQLETGIHPGHADGCQCEICLQSYADGKYSKFIQS